MSTVGFVIHKIDENYLLLLFFLTFHRHIGSQRFFEIFEFRESSEGGVRAAAGVRSSRGLRPRPQTNKTCGEILTHATLVNLAAKQRVPLSVSLCSTREFPVSILSAFWSIEVVLSVY